MTDIFSTFLTFFADHTCKGLLVGIGILAILSSCVALLRTIIKALVTIVAGHPPVASKTVIKCNDVTTETR